MNMTRLLVLALPAWFAACTSSLPADTIRVSGHVEATEVRIGAEVGGRIVDLLVAEGDRIDAGKVVARLDSRDTQLQIDRTRAEQASATAQLRLLEAGSRAEDIRQARAQVDAAASEAAAIDAEVKSAQLDLERVLRLVRHVRELHLRQVAERLDRVPVQRHLAERGAKRSGAGRGDAAERHEVRRPDHDRAADSRCAVAERGERMPGDRPGVNVAGMRRDDGPRHGALWSVLRGRAQQVRQDLRQLATFAGIKHAGDRRRAHGWNGLRHP